MGRFLCNVLKLFTIIYVHSEGKIGDDFQIHINKYVLQEGINIYLYSASHFVSSTFLDSPSVLSPSSSPLENASIACSSHMS